MSVAVILTVFNRKEKTLKCLRSLKKQNDMPNFDIYLCDDKSTDGTSDAVKKEFPNVRIIEGTGNLFWSRGMHCAMEVAVEKGYDYYLMINDDVEFFDTMWKTMFHLYKSNHCIGVTGCTLSKLSGKLTYSGSKFVEERGKIYIGDKLAPDINNLKECDVANWNCFLIDKEVIAKVGLIDPIYEHSFGDYDYSLRMRKLNIPIFISSEYVGYCENNLYFGTYRDSKISAKNRIKKIVSPNGLPIKSWYVFTKRYYGRSALRNFILPYIKFVVAVILRKDC